MRRRSRDVIYSYSVWCCNVLQRAAAAGVAGHAADAADAADARDAGHDVPDARHEHRDAAAARHAASRHEHGQ